MAAKRTKSLTEQQNENVRRIAREILHSKPFNGTESAMATGIGFSQSGLHSFLAGTVGAGMGLLTALSRYTRTPVDDLLQGNRKAGFTDDKFPARAEALQRLDGVIAPQVARDMATREFKGAEALTVADWIADALEDDKRYRRGILPGFAATEDDDRP